MKTIVQPIKTDRLLFRQIVDGDIDNIYKGLSHPEVIKYYGINYDSLEATEEQMCWFSNLEKTGTGVWWAICSLDNKVFYGAVGLNNLKKEHKKAEIGFWLLPEFWQKGIMTEAIPLIYDYGFKSLGLHRIEAIVETENIGSKNTLGKLNFNFEGTMVDSEIKNGKFISLDIYAKIK